MQASVTQGVDSPVGNGLSADPHVNSWRDSAGGSDAFLTIDGERAYRINRFDGMAPFLMSLVSDADLWLYCSSYGPVAAGRVDEEHCLFPYVTDDVLHRAVGQTGPVTILRVDRAGAATAVWEPFGRFPAGELVERSVCKSVLSNMIVFEEVHHGLGLTFRYRWTSSDEFGFVRTATIENHEGARAVRVDLIDGLVNILPAGAGLASQQRYSCLIDAYTRCEVIPDTGVAVYAFTSRITDRAEPAESLTANVVWSRGLPHPVCLLSTDQIGSFAAGGIVEREALLTGRRGAFLIASTVTLEAGISTSWDIVADVGRDQAQVEALCAMLRSNASPRELVRISTQASRKTLKQFVARADGLQRSADERATSHHASCTLFNIMRGGVFADNYQVDTVDFREFVGSRNHTVYKDRATLLEGLPASIAYPDLLSLVSQAPNSPDLIRLAYEYLPLTFSRRHGDPSRPWNRFAIKVKRADGSRILNYQGNWRDIFQNWEALCVSFPVFIESTIAKFVNACTIDGFNPIRVTRDGIDWETPDPEDPWSNIGYWGDHQVIYLLKLLEESQQRHPHVLEDLLAKSVFTYANIPYRIKPYSEIVRNNRQTIDYDTVLESRIAERTAAIGADGKLLQDARGEICHVTLAEKLMVTVLSKLSNFIPGGGIWMNTQRPEWNDANNALVGIGVSMVTLCYLRRHLAFCRDLFAARGDASVPFSAEVASWLIAVDDILNSRQTVLEQAEVGNIDRRTIMDELGAAFSEYRYTVYRAGFSGTTLVAIGSCKDLCDIAIQWLDHTIRTNRRPDGLYHAYNLLDTSSGAEAQIDRLPAMLEGQVAALSSGVLKSDDVARLVDALYASQLYRADQNSFMLYPAKDLPGFLEKNVIPSPAVTGNALLTALFAAGDSTIIVSDAVGNFRFSAEFRNADDLDRELERLGECAEWRDLVAAHRAAVLAVYEDVFHHGEFTGRSGAMYGYEGLGCVYWHMVSKLTLAVQDCHRAACRQGDSGAKRLALTYYRIREGLGFNKTARQYGAFPPDPYSHTPGHSGARQPGMTGQSKEDILTRFGELGVWVEDGRLTFRPTLLRRREFLSESASWSYYDLDGTARTLELSAGSLAFTVCQTPMVYRLGRGSAQRITIVHADGSQGILQGDSLDPATSSDIFLRTGSIVRIEVALSANALTLD
jgi:hypothetical protein